uniref:Uncharacterized protein n=1 Tax=Romanomermis culicivorax TaxID=13658 RepID=A0A915J9F5_ROMCU
MKLSSSKPGGSVRHHSSRHFCHSAIVSALQAPKASPPEPLSNESSSSGGATKFVGILLGERPHVDKRRFCRSRSVADKQDETS